MCVLCELGLLSLNNLEQEILHKNQNSSLLNNKSSNKEIAKVDIEHLTMSSKEINKRLDVVDYFLENQHEYFRSKYFVASAARTPMCAYFIF